MKRFLVFFLLLFFVHVPAVHAQVGDPVSNDSVNTLQDLISLTPTASPSATPTTVPKKEDITKPDTTPKSDLLALFQKRPAKHITWTNFIAFGIQYAVSAGVPANTIILILLLPLLATIIVFFRYIIGLPSLGLLVPIALSITLLSTGIIAGLILLVTILIASLLARFMLKKIRIMQLPKLALSMWLVAASSVVVLTLCATGGILSVKDISIFPILLLVLLSDRVVALFLERSLQETLDITLVTLLLGLGGFLLLSWDTFRNFILLYPEFIILLIPINLLMGRYFGLRVTEHMRFRPIRKHGNN